MGVTLSALGFVALGIVTALAYPYAIRLTIDEGIQGRHLDRINGLGLLMLVLLVAEGVSTFLRDHLFNAAAERAAATLRLRAFAHLLAEDIAFFDSRTTGEITARFSADVPQLQRLAIARAALRRPPVLILDEATSALDAESESLVQDALRALDYRPTTLIVAHRLSTVVNVDRVVVLDRGRIVASGSHDYLLQTSDFYRQLVETQLVTA